MNPRVVRFLVSISYYFGFRQRKKIVFAGGEFYYDGKWMLEKPTLSTGNMVFLNGGKACLIVICDFLLDRGIRHILLPSYLCPTIVTTFETCGITCDYYQINRDFSIEMDDLDRKIHDHRAVLFINYFGFFHPLETQAYFQQFSRRGIYVIEDNAQAGFTESQIGDFSFNSIRKLAPFDGGYLRTRHDVQLYIEAHQGIHNRHLPVIREYRTSLTDYLFQGVGSHDRLQDLYLQAESYYESDPVVVGDLQERHNIESLDWESIKNIRRTNYEYMLALIAEIPQMTSIFPSLQADNSPLGLPVYVSGVSRDWLFDALGNSGIGLTIHWDAILRDPRLNRNKGAVEMSSRILTLVIDQRTSKKQLDYVGQTLIQLLSNQTRN